MKRDGSKKGERKKGKSGGRKKREARSFN